MKNLLWTEFLLDVEGYAPSGKPWVCGRLTGEVGTWVSARTAVTDGPSI